VLCVLGFSVAAGTSLPSFSSVTVSMLPLLLLLLLLLLPLLLPLMGAL
jgi:hypothetical protein